MSRSTRFTEAVAALEQARAQRHPTPPAPDLFASWETPKSATPEWTAAALAALEQAARTHRELTVGDVQWPPTIDGRARGAILREGTRRGWIAPLGWIPSGADRHGRVVVTHADHDQIRAVVRGDTGTFHTVTHRGHLWRCTCPAVGDRCSHVAAARTVTAPTGIPGDQ